MSYVEIYVAGKDGKLHSHSSARNNHGYGPCMWDQVADEAGIHRDVVRGTAKKLPILYDDIAFRELWRRFADGELSRPHMLLMAGTEDTTYFVPGDVLEVADALDACLKAICETNPIVRTMEEMATILRKVVKDTPDLRAVAFNACSARESYWSIYDAEADDTTPFDLGKPQKKAIPSSSWKHV